MKIAVTGATGQLGRLVVEHLKTKGSAIEIVALVRNPEKAADLAVEVRAFDYEQPDVQALQGIDKLLLISGNELGQRARQHANVIEAAKKAGLKSIVYTSLLKADRSTLSLAPEHAATEAAIKDSGLTYTILRNGWYTENYTGSAKGAVGAGAFIGSAGEGKISSAARADYAEAAAVVLVSDAYAGQTLELSGDSAYTLAELAAELSKLAGKTLPYQNLPEAEYAKILTGFGVPEVFAQAIASWDVSASKGDLYDEGKTLSTLIGRPTTPLSKVLEYALAE
jgi:NAD(P)H dehydrogenase (quinone)